MLERVELFSSAFKVKGLISYGMKNFKGERNQSFVPQNLH